MDTQTTVDFDDLPMNSFELARPSPMSS